MVAAHKTIDQMISVFLKYVDKETALKIARDLYQHVEGNKSVHDTFHRIVIKLLEMQDEN